MLVATEKTRRVTILDRRGYFEIQDHLRRKSNSIKRPFNILVKDMQSLINVENAKRIIQLGGLPNEVRDGWAKKISGFVTNSVMPEHLESIQTASARMLQRIERARKQEFDPTPITVKNWVNEQGGNLITNLTAAQMANAHAIIHHQVIWAVTSPYQLAQIIKPAVGLTEREALAVSRFYTRLIEEGIGQRAAVEQVERYAAYLHKVRADRIARTELSNAYNFGQFDSIRGARESGLVDGQVEKSWLAGGPNPCDICLDNEAEGAIPMDTQFSSGDDHPTAHPSCSCSVGYQVVR